MAEEEKNKGRVTRVLQTLTDKKKTGKEKIGGFLWEVFIIIVAVNITLWFHNWNKERQEKELEKIFLIGTRSDLEIVKRSLTNSVTYTQPTRDYYDSVWVQINERRIDKVFIDSYSYQLTNTNYVAFDNSRFESFKSSGYLRLIKNDTLSGGLTYLYTVSLPWQENADRLIYDERRRDGITYIGSKAQIDSSGRVIVSNLLHLPEVKFQIYWQRNMLHERARQKQGEAQEVEKVITMIDRELETRFMYKNSALVKTEINTE